MHKLQSTEVVGVALAGCCSLLVYHLLLSGLIPNQNATLGHDYSLALSWLLDGYYWYRVNGIASIPWFTPSFCAGVPTFPAVQNSWFSVPQWLSFMVDPLTAAYLTLILFAAIGFAGCYLLLRRPFALDPSSALLGAVVFQFNGFFLHRMVIGHLVFHGFMLIPIVACLLLDRPGADALNHRVWRQDAGRIGAISLLLSYMFYSGMASILLPCIMALLAIILVHGIIGGTFRRPIMRFMMAGLVFAGIGLAKLLAGLSFMRNIPRDAYPIPGFDSLVSALSVLFRSLFIHAPTESSDKLLVNSQWLLGQHSFEFGVTIVPLILILVWMFDRLIMRRISTDESPRSAQRSQANTTAVILLVILIALPLCINIYHPNAHAVLKSLPIISSSSNLLRWYTFYIPVLVLFGSISLNQAHFLHRYRHVAACAGIALVILQNIGMDRSYYHDQTYAPGPIISHYRMIQQDDGWRPEITFLGLHQDSDGYMVLPQDRNDALIQGASPISCYEPTFGYRLEQFDWQSLRPGGVFTHPATGVFNMKNPVCYVFPETNNCKPGDHFTLAQHDALEDFIHYRAWQFSLPLSQQLANGFSLIALIGSIIAVLLGLFEAARNK